MDSHLLVYSVIEMKVIYNEIEMNSIITLLFLKRMYIYFMCIFLFMSSLNMMLNMYGLLSELTEINNDHDLSSKIV